MQPIFKKLFRPLLYLIAVVLLLNFFGYFLFQGSNSLYVHLKETIEVIDQQKKLAASIPDQSNQYSLYSDSLNFYNDQLKQCTKDLTLLTNDQNQIFINNVLENYYRSYSDLQNALVNNVSLVSEAKASFLLATDHLYYSFNFWTNDYYYSIDNISLGKLLSLIIAVLVLLYLTIEPIIRNYRSNKSNLQQTKIELIKEKLFLKSILNSQTNFILRLNDSFQLNYVNPAFLKKFKYNEKNIRHLTIYDLIQPKDYYKCRQILEECIHNPEKIFTITLEIPIVGTDEKIWTNLEFINLSSVEHANSEVQVIGVDINEKYHAEKQREETLRTKTFALNHAKMGSWKYNFLTRELTLSLEMLEVLGIEGSKELNITLENFISKYVPQKYHHKILNQVVKAVSSKSHDKETHMSFEIINQRNQKKWFYVSGKFIDKTTSFGIAQDITNQKKSAEALSASNFKFKLLAENAEDIILTTNKYGYFTYITPSIEKALGYTPKEIEKKHFSSLIHYDDYEKVNWKEVAKIGLNSEPITLRFKILSKNQFYIWFECIIKPLQTEDELLYICTARNITQRTIIETEREQLLEEIKQSEELFRTVINSTPDWMYIKDTGQRYLMVNTSYAEQMRLPASEFIGRTELDLKLPYEQKEISPNLISDMEVLKTGITKYSLEENYYVGDRKYTMSTIRIPLVSSDSSIWGVLCIAHNISDMKEAQYSLLYKDKLLQSVADATYELIRNSDLDNALQNAVAKLGANLKVANIGLYNFNASVESPNESTVNMLNWKGSQVDSFEKDEFIPLLTISPIYKQLLEKKIYVEFTKNITDPILKNYLDHNNIQKVTLLPLFVMNQLWGFVSITNKDLYTWNKTEISILQSFTESIAASIERKNFEKELLKEKNNAEIANSVKSNFLSNTTHELKSPLNSIIGFTDLVLKSDITKSQKEFLNNVKGSAKDLQTMINNILEYSNLESGNLELKQEDIMLEDFMADIFDIYQLESMEKNIHFTSYVDPSLPTKISGDAFRIREIISHLLNNAFKYTSTNDDVIISVKAIGSIYHNAHKALQKIEIKVKDTGFGISPKKLKTIFDFFGKNEINPINNNGGMGLGLSISKRLADLMGGTLSIDSVMGKGSTFTLKLDLEVLVPDPLYVNSLPIGINRALVLQKNKYTANYIKATLEYFNIPVVCTEDIEEAVLYLTENNQINLVIVDQFIGNHSGVEFVQRIVNDLNFPIHQTIMMVPGIEMELHENHIKNVGITNILGKPVKTYELYGLLFSVAMQYSNHSISYQEEINKATIMVVEDDEINRMLIQKVLNGLGFEVIAVSSGKDCLDQITINEPVLVFLDLALPVMDGFTTARLIRKLKAPYCNIPIVAISGSASNEDRQKCMDVSINDFIGKPYRYEDIVKVLKKRTLLV